MNQVKRGEIYYADLSPVIGSEQGGIRPVLVLQNDTGNKFSTTTIVAAITSKKERTKLPTHVTVNPNGLAVKSIVMLEQVRTIDKYRLKTKIGELDKKGMGKIDQAMMVSLGLSDLGKDNRK